MVEYYKLLFACGLLLQSFFFVGFSKEIMSNQNRNNTDTLSQQLQNIQQNVLEIAKDWDNRYTELENCIIKVYKKSLISINKNNNLKQIYRILKNLNLIVHQPQSAGKLESHNVSVLINICVNIYNNSIVHNNINHLIKQEIRTFCTLFTIKRNAILRNGLHEARIKFQEELQSLLNNVPLEAWETEVNLTEHKECSIDKCPTEIDHALSRPLCITTGVIEQNCHIWNCRCYSHKLMTTLDERLLTTIKDIARQMLKDNNYGEDIQQWNDEQWLKLNVIDMFMNTIYGRGHKQTLRQQCVNNICNQIQDIIMFIVMDIK